LLLTGCKGAGAATVSLPNRDPLPSVTVATKELNQGTGAQVVNGINELGFGLLRTVSQPSPQKNLCISPASVAIALGIARTGASGNTKTGIAQTYGSQGVPDADLDKTSRDLIGLLTSADPKVEVNLANSLWVAPTVKLKTGYLDRTYRSFGAEVANVDFGRGVGVKQINDWVSKETKGHISSMIDAPNPSISLMILNAVYFKAPWTTPFNKDVTKPGDFHFANGSVSQTPLMHLRGSFSYARVDHAQILSIPYASQRYAMMLYLPDEDSPLSDNMMFLQASALTGDIRKMTLQDVDLTMPKFSAKFTAPLTSPLIALGMKDACNPGAANFKGISDTPLFISEVLHKTTMDVEEEGTVATAATSVTMEATSAGPGAERPPPIEFIANRPFLYAIRDTVTGAILFLGVLYDPGK
jgi:serine protease inhibitor